MIDLRRLFLHRSTRWILVVSAIIIAAVNLRSREPAGIGVYGRPFPFYYSSGASSYFEAGWFALDTVIWIGSLGFIALVMEWMIRRGEGKGMLRPQMHLSTMLFVTMAAGVLIGVNIMLTGESFTQPGRSPIAGFPFPFIWTIGARYGWELDVGALVIDGAIVVTLLVYVASLAERTLRAKTAVAGGSDAPAPGSR